MSDLTTDGFRCPICHTVYPSGSIHFCNNTSVTLPTPQPITMYGWECPRCRTIHAPHIVGCTCRPPLGERAGQPAADPPEASNG